LSTIDAHGNRAGGRKARSWLGEPISLWPCHSLDRMENMVLQLE
jgi:hypothetical protein